MTEDPVERIAEQIEGDGDRGHDAANALRYLNESGQGIHALALAAYIHRLDQDVGTVGQLWCQEAQG